jgi:sugar transferase (PEP-CTERM/EpsH1 system associated)
MLRKTLRPLVHRYIAVSRDLASWLGESIRVAPERISQIYNGVDSSQFFPAAEWSSALFPEGFLPDGDVIVLGTIGRLAEVKDQARVLKMLAVLCADKPALRERLRLVVVGDGPLKDRLREQAVALGIHDLVWMPGDRSDIPALLRAMHIFLLPSLAEGISNTVLEAMATGLPVVATDVGGNPELVRHGVSGYLVPLQDEVRLAQAVSELVDNPQLRQAMGRSALERINTEFDWGKTVNNYLAVYDDLLNNSRSDKRQGNGMVTEG